jgi:leucyl aminopeptidase
MTAMTPTASTSTTGSSASDSPTTSTATTHVSFEPRNTANDGTIVLLSMPPMSLSERGKQIDKESGGHLTKAMRAASFKSARKAVLELMVPPSTGYDRVIIMGCGDMAAPSPMHWTEIGGALGALLTQRKVTKAVIVGDVAGQLLDASAIADLGYGALLRRYHFGRYKSGTATAAVEDAPSEDRANGRDYAPLHLTIEAKSAKAAETAFVDRQALGDGIRLARDLVNEPANALGPVEFAERARGLEAVGVEVEVFDRDQLTAMNMQALLAVAQGSSRPARLVVMQWNGGGNSRAKPIAFVGKGVVFDTGGISMKPAKGMEDMKGDMAGAACVTGLMYALAARKAKVNAVGIIGLVENMPSGDAMRPGDIIGSMAGRTIEVLNTDAEGRLVLADALHYVQERFKPKAIIDLATLTGAIMVALGKEHAGLFSNNDRLAGWLREAGEATGERVWRMPMDPAYDREIDSKTADMKNIGGAYGGAITAAQFLKRFVGDVPWAHLDIAGVAMASNRSDINESWGSGYGIRLLDRLVVEHYEG